jgi:hypothetical protein
MDHYIYVAYKSLSVTKTLDPRVNSCSVIISNYTGKIPTSKFFFKRFAKKLGLPEGYKTKLEFWYKVKIVDAPIVPASVGNAEEYILSSLLQKIVSRLALEANHYKDSGSKYFFISTINQAERVINDFIYNRFPGK